MSLAFVNLKCRALHGSHWNQWCCIQLYMSNETLPAQPCPLCCLQANPVSSDAGRAALAAAPPAQPDPAHQLASMRGGGVGSKGRGVGLKG